MPDASTPSPKCAVCGISAHRYGTTDPEHDFDAMGCVNTLLPEVKRARALLSWIDGACVDELPHMEIRAAIERWVDR